MFHGGEPQPVDLVELEEALEDVLELKDRLDRLQGARLNIPIGLFSDRQDQLLNELTAASARLYRLAPDSDEDIEAEAAENRRRIEAEIAEADAARAAAQLQQAWGDLQVKVSESPMDRQEAVAAIGGLRQLGVNTNAPWEGDESMARQLTPLRRLGWMTAEQLDLDRWRFELTSEGKRLLGVFF